MNESDDDNVGWTRQDSRIINAILVPQLLSLLLILTGLHSIKMFFVFFGLPNLSGCLKIGACLGSSKYSTWNGKRKFLYDDLRVPICGNICLHCGETASPSMYTWRRNRTGWALTIDCDLWRKDARVYKNCTNIAHVQITLISSLIQVQKRLERNYPCGMHSSNNKKKRKANSFSCKYTEAWLTHLSASLFMFTFYEH